MTEKVEESQKQEINHNEEEEIEEEELVECQELTGVLTSPEGVEIPSSICYTNISIIIKFLIKEYPKTYDSDRISINLLGVLELKIIPHSSLLNAPPGTDIESPLMPAVLILTYLDDVTDQGTYKTVMFTCMRKDLLLFKHAVDPIIQQMKENLKFRGPDLTPELGQNHPRQKAKRTRSKSFRLDGSSNILTPAEIDTLRVNLPIREKQLPWHLIYSMREHGVSLDTLYSKCEKKKPLIMIVQAHDKTRFGAFLSQGLYKSGSFYGSAESFVFTFHPLLAVYKSSGKNNYYTIASDHDISIGNSEIGAAIYLGDKMEKGFSDNCDTFASPRLTTKSPYKVYDVEIWAISLTNR